jgi:ABC-2 type transport system ATP-binding protein
LGVDVKKDPVGVRKVVGIIPEQESPPSFLTAEEYIHFVGSIRRVSDVEKEADFWFKKLDFVGEKNMLCKDLSRGTRQKLMIAQAFIHKPRLLLIDEPLVNLDPLVQKVVKDYIRSYARDGNTIFMSSHLLGAMEELADEVAILNHGRILSRGSLREVLSGRAHLEEVFLELVGADHA